MLRDMWGVLRVESRQRRLFKLPFRRTWLLLPLDVICLTASLVISYELRFNGSIPMEYQKSMLSFLLIRPIVYIGFFLMFRLYTRVWRYASIKDVQAVIMATTAATLAVKITDLLLIGPNLPNSVWLSTYLLTLALVSSSRLAIRTYAGVLLPRPTVAGEEHKRVLIYGAGSAGSLLVKEAQRDHHAGWNIVGFIDDNAHKRGLILHGVKILGQRRQLPRIISQYRIDSIIVAMPSLGRQQLRQIIDELETYHIPILIVPPYTRWAMDSLFGHIRPVEVEDLLGRDPLPVDVSVVGNYLNGQIALVTGAGGSIGSEICRQVAALNPAQLILLGRGENSIFEIEHELRHRYPALNVGFVIGDIRDEKKMERLFQTYHPTVVFHAAAHKHVPLMEAHPDEAFVNNILGTQNLVELSDKYGVDRFILISSDKAVRPTNVMGASKRIAEMVVQSYGKLAKTTTFITVRFGNVLGSRGSVVRVFRQQIAQGGPVTVTDERMVRYFMTIPEAVRLVAEAGAVGENGRVYLLDMGEPVRIVDLAERMIRLSGFVPDIDIPIKFTGIRPGEKLYEELSRESDSVSIDANGRIWSVSCPVMPYHELLSSIAGLSEQYMAGAYPELGESIKILAWWEPDLAQTDMTTASQVAVSLMPRMTPAIN